MAHGALLRQESDDPELASQIMYDYTLANLSPRLRGMLNFANKLTRDPGSMQQSDVQTLRDLGINDEEILSVVLITCNYNFMTRLADGLGVEVPDSHQKYVEGWITGPAKEQEWLMKQKA